MIDIHSLCQFLELSVRYFEGWIPEWFELCFLCLLFVSQFGQSCRWQNKTKMCYTSQEYIYATHKFNEIHNLYYSLIYTCLNDRAVIAWNIYFSLYLFYINIIICSFGRPSMFGIGHMVPSLSRERAHSQIIKPGFNELIMNHLHDTTHAWLHWLLGLVKPAHKKTSWVYVCWTCFVV